MTLLFSFLYFFQRSVVTTTKSFGRGVTVVQKCHTFSTQTCLGPFEFRSDPQHLGSQRKGFKSPEKCGKYRRWRSKRSQNPLTNASDGSFERWQAFSGAGPSFWGGDSVAKGGETRPGGELPGPRHPQCPRRSFASFEQNTRSWEVLQTSVAS